MIGKARTAWVVSTATVALVFLAASVPRAQAQQQVCCQYSQGNEITCQTETCTDTAVVGTCEVYSYGTGFWYNVLFKNCCGTPLPDFYNTNQICYIGGYLARGKPLQTQLTKLIWVQDCRGRYVLLRVPIDTYSA